MTTASLAALTDDPRLQELADLLKRPGAFNLVTALGLSRQELRHSDLLAFLLDPAQPHGLGDAFARMLLARAAAVGPRSLPVERLKLTRLSVWREWRYIDILLESRDDHLAVIIENKVDADELTHQLDTYYREMELLRPGWTIFGIFLTPTGTLPAAKHNRARYAPLTYGDVAAALEELEPTATEPAARLLLGHYAQLIRSTITMDHREDLTRLGCKLYVQHREALEAINAARAARQNMIQRWFTGLLRTSIANQPDLLKEESQTTSGMRYITRFAPVEWYCPKLQVAERWTPSGLVLLFQFLHEPGGEGVWLDLCVGPAAPQHHELRNRLYGLAQAGAPFTSWYSDPSSPYFSIYGRTFLAKETNFFAEYDDAQIRQAIDEGWAAFLRDDLPAIMTMIRARILL